MQHENERIYVSAPRLEDKKNEDKTRQQIDKFNFKVLQRNYNHISSILVSLQYVVLARYSIDGKFWSYLKVKGPAFLVDDKYKRLELIIMNQWEVDNFPIKFPEGTKFQLKQLDNGYLLSYMKEDSQVGYIVEGIWTSDPKIEQVSKILKENVRSS